MSENAKKKRSRKQSPEELLNEAVANHGCGAAGSDHA